MGGTVVIFHIFTRKAVADKYSVQFVQDEHLLLKSYYNGI